MLLSIGKQRTFERTVRAFGADLFRFALWLCRDRFVAEELVQETFARAWSAWESLRDPGNPKPWLMRILRNEHARLYERKRLDYCDEELEELAITDNRSVAGELEIGQLIEALPIGLREPFLMQTLGGFSCAEIAEQLEISEGAAMVRLTRARQALRRLIAGGDAPARRQRGHGRG
ncbi:MAG: sigma-70 family RNA polymerase sigma factor [Rhodocyclaceae bacterium]|nr:sigma-70 family RNA polymerase sigma factor [Rhodocyclaceae bacterium]